MKLTKAKFKTAMHTIFSLSFLCAFGVGHLIANNTPDFDEIRPVVTVPVIHRALSPDVITYSDEDFNDLFISYNWSGEVNESYNYSFNLDLFLSGGELYCDIEFLRDNLVTYDNLTDSYSFSIGAPVEVNTSIPVVCRWYTNPAIVNMPVNVICDFSIIINNVTYSYRFVDSYAYGTMTDIFNVYIVNDYISKDFYNFCFVYLPNYKDVALLYVMEHLEDYGLYTYQDYIAYGQSEYYRGLANGNQVMSVSQMIREIFRSPVSMFQNAFNVVLPLPDGTTLDLGAILTFFLTIGIALTIVSLISKIGGK